MAASIFMIGDLPWLASAAARLVLAFILGGMVGYEREQASRPAGFRTHTLVCLGSALVMLTGEYIAQIQGSGFSVDPTRLGAQVVSGIGFLGAGTIIRTGGSVRGLTTAASLWAVACIGLAAGSGFLPGAVIATILTFLVLTTLKSIEKKLANRRSGRNIQILLRHYSADVSEILKLADQLNLKIRRIQLLPAEEDEPEDQHVRLRLSLSRLDPQEKEQFVSRIYQLATVMRVIDD